MRQVTLLNLGRHFPHNRDDWPLLCARIEQLIGGVADLLPIECPVELERVAQRIVGQLVKRAPVTEAVDDSKEQQPVLPPATESPAYDSVDIDSLTLNLPRTVGIEHVALHAMKQLDFPNKLSELGINGTQCSAIIGNIIGRMAQPASELATWHWLQDQSALGELLDVDFEALSHMSLYRGSDALMRKRDEIETHIFGAVKDLFGLDQTITLYDLTNTYFEGSAENNEKAQYGRSKEKRKDCPLVTLGLVLDGSGFVHRSQTFAGNTSEFATLEQMLTGLKAQVGALVVMDAGIASQANIDWLIEQGYRYLVVKRGGKREFDHTQAQVIKNAAGGDIQIYKTINESGSEVELHCHSQAREAKERAMLDSAMQRFEASLQTMSDNLAKPRCEKSLIKLQERLGRLKQKSAGASQHYQVELITDEAGKKVTTIRWEKQLVEGSRATDPGVYCLRTNELSWDAETLWRTYVMLTDLESVFRSLKSELGLRPVFHSTENRVDGHRFITVLAYQFVQVIRTQLKQAGIQGSWTQIRKILGVQQRVTSSLTREKGGSIHIRKATTAEPELKEIYQALGIHAAPGGIKKMVS
ncbi:FIG00855313: hypothetical protein [hydrothermal vent metagenome]|uniref:Transposase IS4-like domain-containing protein n=1 Tax=hydrothermal vent metagenome TaxID=652676 RepID=A0A3B0YYT7_9ZZZZ